MNALKTAALLPILLSLFSAQTLFAAEEFPERVVCLTLPETTTLLLERDEDQVHLTLTHKNGTKYMPLHSGIITPSDLELLEKRAKILSEMGAEIKYSFPKERCQRRGERLTCGVRKQMKLGDVEIWGFDLMVDRYELRSSLNPQPIVFHRADFGFTFKVSDRQYEAWNTTMNYYEVPEYGCMMTESN